jgi:PKD repeat protein
MPKQQHFMKLCYLSLLCIIILCTCSKEKQEKGAPDFIYKKECIGGTPCTVKFTNKSTGDATFIWDFGDNSQNSGDRDPSHTYTSGTSFTVTLTAQYANVKKTCKQVINLTPLGNCETKGSFSCAKRILSAQPVEDKMSGLGYNYYYFVVDTPGAVYLELNAVPGAGSEHYYAVTVLSSAAASNSNTITSVRAKSGEVISFYTGPLANKEYYVEVRERYTIDTTQTFKLTYKFIDTDLNEPNSTFASATLLPLSVAKKGTILAGHDIDVFKYYQTTPGTVDITITPVPDFGKNYGLKATAYKYASSANASYIDHQYSLSGENLKMAVGPLDTGYHYVILENPNNRYSTDQYTITAKQDTGDVHEINNSFFEATPIQLDIPVSGTINAAGDEDYFKFTATKNEPVNFYFPTIPDGLGYAYIDFYGDANSADRLSTFSSYQNKPLNYTTGYSLEVGKTYYIRFHAASPRSESSKQYKLTVHQ